MTKLLTTEFEDETGTIRTLTRQEVLVYTQVLAGAGNETTGRLIGWLGKVLGRAPGPAPGARRGPLPDPEHDRGDPALRADRSARRALRRPRRRVLRHDRACRKRDVAARRLGQPRRAALRGSRPLRHPPGRSASTSRSATASTSASARPSPGSRAGWPSTRCSTGSPSGRSTTTTCGRPTAQRCGVGHRCPSWSADVVATSEAAPVVLVDVEGRRRDHHPQPA